MPSTIKKLAKNFASRHQATILTYHGVVSDNLPIQCPQHVPETLFRSHIHYISTHFNCVSLVDLLNDITRGRVEPKTVVLTFDDGFYNNCSKALPILEQFKVPAIVFIASGFTGTRLLIWPEILSLMLAHTKKPKTTVNNQEFVLNSPESKLAAYRAITQSFKNFTYEEVEKTIYRLLDEHDVTLASLCQSEFYDDFRLMDWTDIKTLINSGMITIGSHTVNHRRLSHLSYEDALWEINDSKLRLENQLGKIDFFAYPFGGNPGDYSDRHVQLVKDSGYQAAVSAMEGCVSTSSDIYQLPRVGIGSSHTVQALDYLLNGGNAFLGGFSIAAVARGIFLGRTV